MFAPIPALLGPQGQVFCSKQNLLRRCHECNFPLGERDLFCPRCGAKQRREKSRVVTPAQAGAHWFRVPAVAGMTST